jgi:hypothetical protein
LPMSNAATRSMICSSSSDSTNTEPHPSIVTALRWWRLDHRWVTVRGAAGQTAKLILVLPHAGQQ